MAWLHLWKAQMHRLIHKGQITIREPELMVEIEAGEIVEDLIEVEETEEEEVV